jgi:hypothetical protein
MASTKRWAEGVIVPSYGVVARAGISDSETSRRCGPAKGVVDGLPGRPGWLSTQAPHRPVRAGLPHTVLQATVSLRGFQAEWQILRFGSG